MKTTIKFSSPSKMPCYTWSLRAIKTCPGSKQSNGELVDACKGCYATDGNYLRFKNVNKAREFNEQDWKREEWVTEMVDFLDTQRYFRWFDSGDIAYLKLAEKIYEVCKSTPWCHHWIPTRQYKFKKFEKILDKLQALPNVSVRYSSDSVLGDYQKGFHGSVIIPNDQFKTEAVICRAYENNGECGSCRVCWDKSIPTVAYVAHGNKMLNLIKTLQTA